MAVILDERVRAAITQRRARRRDVAITLTVVKPRCMPAMLTARWGVPRAWDGTVPGRDSEGKITLCLGPRVARYVTEHDITITIPRLGPFARLMVDEEACIMLELEDWERATVSCPEAGRTAEVAGMQRNPPEPDGAQSRRVAQR